MLTMTCYLSCSDRIGNELGEDADATSSEPLTTGEKGEPAEEGGVMYDDFVEKFPVTLDGKPPTKRKRAAAGFLPHVRTFDDRWRLDQLRLRRQHILCKCTHSHSLCKHLIYNPQT